MRFKIFIIIVLVFFFGAILPGGVLAQNINDAFTPGGPMGNVVEGAGYDTEVDPYGYVARLINVFLSIIGVLFLVLMIYGGYTWMTASGDEQKVTKAKNMITAAVIGVIIVVSAYAITYFVVDSFSQGSLEGAGTPGSSVDDVYIP